ncbi:MAG: glycoside hydrolase [Bacteroides sp. SM23_62_1]|nr:MAG: glycoside hydrolase [Bacteroides sp. SM23_62_1]
MKSIIRSLIVISLLVTFNSSLTSAQAVHAPQMIKVDGNRFINESGETVIFHGVNFSDPDKLDRAGKWTKKHFTEAKNWGANIVRLPVHPSAWRDRGSEEYIRLLDKAVQWARELDLHLIIDWHSIGNLRTEQFQSKSYNTTMEETCEFWRIISEKYAGEPVVAMYELYNEPTTYNGRLGELSWEQWKEMNQEMIEIIRKNNPEAVILVAGFNWAYDLTVVKENPINTTGIAYVSHPYPQKREKPWEPQWEKDWGFVADTYPVILTEIGYALPEEKGVHIPVFGDEEYGNAIVKYTAAKGISWVIWCFDPDWSPVMFTDWDYTPSSQGKFFKEVMLND